MSRKPGCLDVQRRVAPPNFCVPKAEDIQVAQAAAGETGKKASERFDSAREAHEHASDYLRAGRFPWELSPLEDSFAFPEERPIVTGIVITAELRAGRNYEFQSLFR